MASHIQVHASIPRVGAVDGVNGKIDTVRVFIGGGVHTRASFDFYPQLQGILFRSSSRGEGLPLWSFLLGLFIPVSSN